jgi:hypothetical protein
MAEVLAELHAQLSASTGIPPLNHPLTTLRRYELLKTLHDEGLNNFRVFGAWEDYSDVRFPAFVRSRERDGGVPDLLHSHKEIERAIGKELLDGWSLEDLLVVEFEDTSDEEGRFRKYSAYVIGSRVVACSSDPGRRWVMRNDAAEFDERSSEEELRFVQENPHKEELARIFEIADTQFGRIDYSLKEGRIQTWEINTLPLMRRPVGSAPRSEDQRELRKPRKELFKALYTEAWNDLLASVPPGHPTRPTFTDHRLARASEEVRSRGVTTRAPGAVFPGLRRLLRPIKPLVKPVAAWILHPILSRRARRRIEGQQ